MRITPGPRGRRRIVVTLGALAVIVGLFANCESLPVVRPRLDAFRGADPVPPLAAINRDLGLGTHPYLDVLPRAAESPGLRRIVRDPAARADFLASARVRIAMTPDYAHIDDEAGLIIVSWWYYHLGANLDLYLDLLHELAHIRQLREGKDLWDASLSYADRPTEIEGYAVAAEEGRRLGMTEARLFEHLHNPWMTEDDVRRLLGHIAALIEREPLPDR